MRVSAVVALIVAVASAAPALAYTVFAPRDYDKLVSRAWIDGQGKVHYAKGVKSGRKGCGSTPRSLDNVELYTRAQKLAHLYARDYDAYYLD